MTKDDADRIIADALKRESDRIRREAAELFGWQSMMYHCHPSARGDVAIAGMAATAPDGDAK